MSIYSRAVKNIDGKLLFLTCTLFIFSLITLWSASGSDWNLIASQLRSFGVALTVMYVVANLPPHYIKVASAPLYLGTLVLLGFTELVGYQVKGAQRWLDLYFIRIQPSELMKIALPLMLAWYLDRYERILKIKNYFVAAILILIPLALILKQPDLGTAILVFMSGFFVLFFSGLSVRVFAFCATLFLLVAPFFWTVLHPYQQNRILTLLNPSADPLGAGYQSIQSTIAIGSGGLMGKGWLEGTQSRLNFLPEGTTDFIFAVVGEEFGFVGGLVLLWIYSLLIARGLKIAANAPTMFSRLVAVSIPLTICIYIFVNIGMVVGILPVVGVPLPLLSFGGTSAVTILFGIGVLMNVQSNRRLVPT